MSSSVSYGFLPGVTTAGEDDKQEKEVEPTGETLDPDDIVTDENTYRLRGATFGTKQGVRKDITDRVDDYPDYETEKHDQPKPHISLDTIDGQLHKSTLQMFELYCRQAYMSQEKYRQEMINNPYGDNRDNSYLVENNGAEARIYEYQNSLVIVFRGTEKPDSYVEGLTGGLIRFLSDVGDDLNAKVRSIESVWSEEYNKEWDELGNFRHYDIGHQGIIHQGFNNYVNRLYGSLQSIIFAPRNRRKSLYLSGHSLGAISSQIFAYKLYLFTGLKAEGIYTFGAPAGIWTFEDQLSKFNLYNVIHEKDFITYFMPIFNHSGVVIVVNDVGEYEIYQGQDIPHIPFDNETTNAYALRKNGKLEGVGELVRDTTWDSYLHQTFLSRGVVEGLESLRSLISAMRQTLVQESLGKATEIYNSRGTLPHTQYEKWVDALPDLINVPQYNPDEPHTFNNIDDEHKERFNHKGSHKHHHIYEDTKTGEHVLIKENLKNYSIAPLNNKKPLGVIFYKNNEDIKNKLVMFYN